MNFFFSVCVCVLYLHIKKGGLTSSEAKIHMLISYLLLIFFG